MSAQSGWTEDFTADSRIIRETRSGLSGFGGRPALHPAWRSPDDEEDVTYLVAARARRPPPLQRAARPWLAAA